MKRTGEILKTSRETKGLSLHEVGMSLKINPKTLQAIEEGDTTRLPARTFLRGFVKSYAQFLKLNLNEVLIVFQEEIGEFRPQAPAAMTKTAEDSETETSTPQVEAPPTKTPNRIAPKSELSDGGFELKKLGGVFLVFTLVVLIVVVARLVNKYQKERVAVKPTLELLQKEPLKEIAATTTESKVTVVDAVSELIKKPEQKTEQKVEPKPEPKPEPKKITTQSQLIPNITLPPPVPVQKKPTLAAAKPAAPAPAAPTVAATALSDTTKPLEVIIEALNNVEVTYDLGDGKTRSLSLNQDQVQAFKSTTKINLNISDGGAINVIVNGRERGIPGAAGKSIKLSYPQ